MKLINRVYAALCFTVVFVFVGTGCNSLKHWQYVATDTKVTQEKVNTIAPKVAILFPPRVEYKPGEAIVTHDTVIDVDALLQAYSVIDSLLYTLSLDSVNRDSVKQAILSGFKPRKISQKVFIRDTVYQANSSALSAVYDQLEQCRAETSGNKAALALSEARAIALSKSKYSWFYWFLGASVLALVFLILLLKRR